MRCGSRWFAGLVVLGVCLGGAAAARAGAAPAAPAAPAPTLQEALKALPTYEFGQSREGLTVISDALRDAKGAERAGLVGRLAALLGNAAATPDSKRYACRELSLAGTAKEVPALAALLLDKDLSDMARYALERIEDPAALEAMRGAVAKASAKQKIGLLNSLGMRKDAAAVPLLVAALKDADVAVAAAGAAALGKVGSADAAKALAAARAAAPAELKPVLADACLLCADARLAEKQTADAAAIYEELYKPAEPKHVRLAALRGLVAAGGEKVLPLLTAILTGQDAELQASALRFLREVSTPATANALVGLMPKLPAATQALLLDDLATRGDASALPAVTAAAQSADEAVKTAAVRALGRLGNASTLGLLTQLAVGTGPLADAARQSLDRLPAADVNPALVALADKGDAKVRAEALRSLGVRRANGALPVALKAAQDADAGVRTAALGALDGLADEKSVPALVGLVTGAKADPERDAAEKVLGSLCSRAANKDACVQPILGALTSAAAPAKCALVRVLGRAGTPAALNAVRAASKDAAPEIQDAAIRSLADWSDATAAADLLAIAKTAEKTTHQVLALRGYIRLAGTDLPDAQKLKMYQDAMAAAKRPDEKVQVLGGLGNMKSVEALKMVEPCLADDALREPAAAAAVKIAKALGKAGKAAVLEVMQKVMTATKDKNVRGEAEKIFKDLGGTPPKAAGPQPDVRIWAAPASSKKAGSPAAEPLGWRLGMQSYSFNRFSFAESLEKTAGLGLKYIEIYPGQRLSPDKPDVKTSHDMSDADLAEMKKMAEAKGIRIVNYGVVGLSKDEAASRKVFEFARKVGIETICSEPPDDAFDTIAKLCDEYAVNVALHNHPKPSRYWDPAVVLKACEGRTKRIGACADTGHWMRSGLDPLECLKKLEGRIISLHFKDLDKMGPVEKGQPGPHDVPWGTGAANAKALLGELRRQGFRGVFSIEYEHNWDNSVPDIAKAVEFFRATAASLAGGR